MSNPGASPGRSESWWARNSSSRTLNPNRIGTHGVKDEDAVKRYQQRPNDSSGGGSPICVIRRPDGSLWAREGAHRIEAARREGRSVRVKVVDQTKEAGQQR